MSKVSPVQRSLKHLRDQGFTCGKVEVFNPHVKIRQDFCGGIDVIAFRGREDGDFDVVRPAAGIVGVQVCGGSGDLGKHRTKLLAEPRMRVWVEAGGRLLLHSWRKVNERQKGKRKLWSCLEEELTLSSFPASDAQVQDKETDHGSDR